MKKFTILNYLLAFSILILNACNTKTAALDDNSADEYPETELGWKLGSQAYTFKSYTFLEAIDKIDSCGLKYVEAYPGQNIGGGLEGKMHFSMDESTRKEVLQKLNEKGIKLHGYGVVRAKDEREWRELFEFAKAMGIETITSEPDEKHIPLLSSLCDEYEINLAIHNHPDPSYYWNPDVVANAIKGQSKRMGACADIGHWVRSGLDPVESLKKLEGHILHMHLKDLNEKGNKKAHDVHWGEGVSNVPGVIEELKRQKFSGMISAEYEHNWDNNAPDVAASVVNFRNIIKTNH